MALFRRNSPRKAFAALPPEAKAITFYAEDGGSWPHFAPIVRHLTEVMEREICYLTSQDDDPVLSTDNLRIHAIHLGSGVGRTMFFGSLEGSVVVVTMPDLGNPVFPRSHNAKRLDMHYVYVFHSMVSTHMIYEPAAFDDFDVVLCVGPHMEPEIRRREDHAGLGAKALVPHGYGRLDDLIAAVAAQPARPPSDVPVVLIAPSWGPHGLIETIGVDVVRTLLDAGFEVVVRPHPMTAVKSPAAIAALDQFASHERFSTDTDMASVASLLRSDLMISDWSGAALEYAFGLERPVVFIDTDRKVNNPAYAELGIEPIEATIRPRIGRVVASTDLAALPGAVRELMASASEVAAQLVAVREETIFNVGSSGIVGATEIARLADSATGAGRHL